MQAVLATEYTYPSVSAICSQAVANKWSRLYAVGQSWAACPLSMSLPATFSLCMSMMDCVMTIARISTKHSIYTSVT
jgi:hypothetical protein